MTTLIKVSIFSDDLPTTDWDMVKVAAEHAAQWADSGATISVYPPYSDGTRHYPLAIRNGTGVIDIVIGVLKRPGSDVIEFHS